MNRHRSVLLAATCALAAIASPAHAGWYVITNYVGTIGKLPVHVSLQTHRDRDDAESSRIDGSYYYDAHRLPIVLQGKRGADGQMTLCEASTPASFSDSPVVPPASPAHPVPCPITLKTGTDQATGTWHDGARTLPIALHQVGSLDDTGDAPRLTGSVEIPMWHHTPKHLLLGVYTSSPACPLSMSRLRLVNLATGHIDREMPFECGTGTVSTPIYANVYSANDPRHVTVIFQGGFHGMGDDREIKVEP